MRVAAKLLFRPLSIPIIGEFAVFVRIVIDDGRFFHPSSISEDRSARNGVLWSWRFFGSAFCLPRNGTGVKNLPRNGSGVASQPPNTRGGPANTPISSTKYNSVVDDIYQLLNDPLPIVAGGTGASSVAAAQAALSVDGKVVYSTKAANYTLVAGDNNGVIRFTAAATASLTAAATLATNWHATIIADGGAVTIDPNASETINGATALIIPDGGATTIYCDGAGFYTGPGAGSITGDSLNGGPLGGLMNAVINGGFDVAKRGTSLAAGTGFKYATDRWARVSAGSTLAFSRQEFSPGVTTPPGNARYFGRFTVVSVASATNYAAIYHAMEDVKTFAGKTVTVTFYAKADASKNIGFELYQWFGLGGSPSSAITGIGAQQCALTTSWQRFDILVNVPSISGKTRGTDNNDHLELVFWMDAGSTFASRASSIGQQSGTYDITRVSVREGDCRNEVDPFCARPIGLEETLCARYFQTFSDIIVSGYNSAGNTIFGETKLSPQMRSGNATPAFSLNSTSSSNASGLSLNGGNSQRVRVAANVTATGAGHILYDMTADFEI